MRQLIAATILALGLALAGPAGRAQDEPPPTPAPKTSPPASATAGPDASGPLATPLATTPAAPAKAEAPAPAPRPQGRLAAGQPMPPGELEAFVDGVVSDAMRRDHIGGLAVAVVQNGQVVFKKGYGFARLAPQQPVDPDRTLFRIGSISKTFTWIAVMKAVEAGRMRLEAPVNLYLPPEDQVPADGFDQPVRVQDLMDHTPGFEDRVLGQLFEKDYSGVRPLQSYLHDARPRRVRPPGQVSSYSNYGAGLAGEAAAFVAHKPYERLIEDSILFPARLTHTTFREPHPVKPGLPTPMAPALAADVSDGFHWSAAGFAARPYEYIEQIAPAGAGSSTAGDMARYMLLQLNGGTLDGATIYGPETARAFRTPLLSTPPGINGWAHGLNVSALPGGFTGYGHDGATLSFFSNMTVVPQLGLGVFVTANTDTSAPFVGGLAASLVQRFYAPAQVYPRPGDPNLVQDARTYAGGYLGTRRSYHGLEGFVMRLLSGAKVSVTPQGKLLVVQSGGAGLFVPDGSGEAGRFVASQGEGHLVFFMEDGRARAFEGASGSQRFERAPFWKKPGTLILLSALAAAAALFTLGGTVVRLTRERRESAIQSRAATIQNIQAGLWLTAMILFGLWGAKAVSDQAWVVFSWPGPLVILASACALVASALTVTTVVALPAIWSGGRRVESWTDLRKAAFTVTVLIYTAFAVLLGGLGALVPWSG